MDHKKQDPDLIRDVIEEVDSLFAKNDMAGAGKVLENALESSRKNGDSSSELSILNELLGYYRKTSQRKKAFVTLERCEELLGSLRLFGTVTEGTVLLNAATVLKSFDENEKAVEYYKRAETVLETALNTKDPLLAGLYNNEAVALESVGDLTGALRYYKMALKVLEGDPDALLDAGITYVNQAHLYEKMGRDSDLTDRLEKAIETLFDPRIKNDGYMAFVFSKCSPSFRHFKMESIADELDEISNAIYERNRNG